MLGKIGIEGSITVNIVVQGNPRASVKHMERGVAAEERPTTSRWCSGYAGSAARPELTEEWQVDA